MTAILLLLGRPWLYDRKVKLDAKRNAYSFIYRKRLSLILEEDEEFNQAPLMVGLTRKLLMITPPTKGIHNSYLGWLEVLAPNLAAAVVI